MDDLQDFGNAAAATIEHLEQGGLHGAAQAGARRKPGAAERETHRLAVQARFEEFTGIVQADLAVGAALLAREALGISIEQALAFRPGRDVRWTSAGAVASVAVAGGQVREARSMVAADLAVEALACALRTRHGSTDKRLADLAQGAPLTREAVAQRLKASGAVGDWLEDKASVRLAVPRASRALMGAAWAALEGAGGGRAARIAWSLQRGTAGVQAVIGDQGDARLDMLRVACGQMAERLAQRPGDEDWAAIGARQAVPEDWDAIDARSVVDAAGDHVSAEQLQWVRQALVRLAPEPPELREAAKRLGARLRDELYLCGALAEPNERMSEAQYARLAECDIEVAAALLHCALFAERGRFAARRRPLADYCQTEDGEALYVRVDSAKAGGVVYEGRPRVAHTAAREAMALLQRFAAQRPTPREARLVTAGAPRGVRGPLAAMGQPRPLDAQMIALDAAVRAAGVGVTRAASIFESRLEAGLAQLRARWAQAAREAFARLARQDEAAAQALCAALAFGLSHEEAAWLRLTEDFERDGDGVPCALIVAREREGGPMRARNEEMRLRTRELAGTHEMRARAIALLEAQAARRGVLDEPLYAAPGPRTENDRRATLGRLRDALRAAAIDPQAQDDSQSWFAWHHHLSADDAIGLLAASGPEAALLV